MNNETQGKGGVPWIPNEYFEVKFMKQGTDVEVTETIRAVVKGTEEEFFSIIVSNDEEVSCGDEFTYKILDDDEERFEFRMLEGEEKQNAIAKELLAIKGEKYGN